jgi:putative membrane protein
MMQVALSRIAATKTTNPKVRKFAVTTIANMAQAGGALHVMAKMAGKELPQQPPADVQQLARGLSADTGGTLDHEYMAQIVPASTVAVNLFKDEGQKGENPQLVAFAKKMLPKIEQHQKMAVELSQNMGQQQAKAEKGVPQGGAGGSAPPKPASPSGK